MPSKSLPKGHCRFGNEQQRFLSEDDEERGRCDKVDYSFSGVDEIGKSGWQSVKRAETVAELSEG